MTKQRQLVPGALVQLPDMSTATVVLVRGAEVLVYNALAVAGERYEMHRAGSLKVLR
jgi:hypothetical protein